LAYFYALVEELEPCVKTHHFSNVFENPDLKNKKEKRENNVSPTLAVSFCLRARAPFKARARTNRKREKEREREREKERERERLETELLM
jgi:hypothetical protein